MMLRSATLLFLILGVGHHVYADSPFPDLTRRIPERPTSPGCVYEGVRYKGGDNVDTPNPCLNCTCNGAVLVCYLRLCPTATAPPPGCFPAREVGQCCPTLVCAEQGPNLSSSRNESGIDLRPIFQPPKEETITDNSLSSLSNESSTDVDLTPTFTASEDESPKNDETNTWDASSEYVTPVTTYEYDKNSTSAIDKNVLVIDNGEKTTTAKVHMETIIASNEDISAIAQDSEVKSTDTESTVTGFTTFASSPTEGKSAENDLSLPNNSTEFVSPTTTYDFNDNAINATEKDGLVIVNGERTAVTEVDVQSTSSNEYPFAIAQDSETKLTDAEISDNLTDSTSSEYITSTTTYEFGDNATNAIDKDGLDIVNGERTTVAAVDTETTTFDGHPSAIAQDSKIKLTDTELTVIDFTTSMPSPTESKSAKNDSSKLDNSTHSTSSAYFTPTNIYEFGDNATSAVYKDDLVVVNGERTTVAKIDVESTTSDEHPSVISQDSEVISSDTESTVNDVTTFVPSAGEGDSLVYITSTTEPISYQDVNIYNDIPADGCMVNGTLYADGSAMLTSTYCQYCFCIRGKKMCLKPKCQLTIDGCTPRYDNHYTCCPTRYECTNTAAPTEIGENTTLSSTTDAETSHFLGDAVDCFIAGTVYHQGSLVPDHKPCHNCYCKDASVICEKIQCTPPIEGCTPIIPQGHCCPISFRCDYYIGHQASSSIKGSLFNDSAIFMAGDEAASLKSLKNQHSGNNEHLHRKVTSERESLALLHNIVPFQRREDRISPSEQNSTIRTVVKESVIPIGYEASRKGTDKNVELIRENDKTLKLEVDASPETFEGDNSFFRDEVESVSVGQPVMHTFSIQELFEKYFGIQTTNISKELSLEHRRNNSKQPISIVEMQEYDIPESTMRQSSTTNLQTTKYDPTTENLFSTTELVGDFKTDSSKISSDVMSDSFSASIRTITPEILDTTYDKNTLENETSLVIGLTTGNEENLHTLVSAESAYPAFINTSRQNQTETYEEVNAFIPTQSISNQDTLNNNPSSHADTETDYGFESISSAQNHSAFTVTDSKKPYNHETSHTSPDYYSTKEALIEKLKSQTRPIVFMYDIKNVHSQNRPIDRTTQYIPFWLDTTMPNYSYEEANENEKTYLVNDNIEILIAKERPNATASPFPPHTENNISEDKKTSVQGDNNKILLAREKLKATTTSYPHEEYDEQQKTFLVDNITMNLIARERPNGTTAYITTTKMPNQQPLISTIKPFNNDSKETATSFLSTTKSNFGTEDDLLDKHSDSKFYNFQTTIQNEDYLKETYNRNTPFSNMYTPSVKQNDPRITEMLEPEMHIFETRPVSEEDATPLFLSTLMSLLSTTKNNFDTLIASQFVNTEINENKEDFSNEAGIQNTSPSKEHYTTINQSSPRATEIRGETAKSTGHEDVVGTSASPFLSAEYRTTESLKLSTRINSKLPTFNNPNLEENKTRLSENNTHGFTNIGSISLGAPLAVGLADSMKDIKEKPNITYNDGIIYLDPKLTDIGTKTDYEEIFPKNRTVSTEKQISTEETDKDLNNGGKKKGSRKEDEPKTGQGYKIIPFVAEDAIRSQLGTINDTLVTEGLPDIVSDFCFIKGRIYMNGEMIGKPDPCELCRCFYGRELCQIQRCPTPPPDCVLDKVPGFCCPRFTCGNNVTSKESMKLVGIVLPSEISTSTTKKPNITDLKPTTDKQDVRFGIRVKVKVSTPPFIRTSESIPQKKTIEDKAGDAVIFKPQVTSEIPITSKTAYTTSSTITTTKATPTPPFPDPWGLLKVSGCNIYGKFYNIKEEVEILSGPCSHCICTVNGVDCNDTC